MTAPQVSVVLPTRNRPTLLRQAIDSVLAQEGVEIELIVVDDASTDETPAMLSELLGDDRVLVVRHDSVRGPAVSRNDGIERVQGEWIAFLDDDDFFGPEKLRIQIEDALWRGAPFSYSGRIEVDRSGLVLQRRLMTERPTLAVDLLQDNVVGGPSAVVASSELLQEVGDFDERLPPLEDWDMWIRMAAVAAPSVLRDPLYAYRRHPGNLWVTAAARIPNSFAILREKHRAAAATAGSEFGAAWITRWEAAQDLAAGRRLRAARKLLRTARRERSPRDAARALLALGGKGSQRIGTSMMGRITPRPQWLDRAGGGAP